MLCSAVMVSSRGGLAGSASSSDVPEPVLDDHFSSHICESCRSRVVSLEKAVADLAKFKLLAGSSLEIRTLKRTKDTSGEVGVSPNTVHQRPRAKVARKKLIFQSKYNTNVRDMLECHVRCSCFACSIRRQSYVTSQFFSREWDGSWLYSTGEW